MAGRIITYERLLRRDRKHKTFLFFFTLILIAAGVLFIRHTDDRLTEYELSQPANVMKAFVSDLSESKPENAYGRSVPAETYSYLVSLSEGKTLTFREVIQSNENERHFNLFANSDKIALVRLEQRALASGEHYARWSVSSVEPVVSEDSLALSLLNKFNNHDFGEIINSVDASLFPAESKEDFAAYLNNAAAGKTFTLSESASSTENEKEFVYLLEGERFFSVFMKKDPAAGNAWSLTASRPHFLKPVTYTAEIPQNALLSENSRPVPSEFMKGTVDSAHAQHISESAVNPVNLSLIRYEIPFAFKTPSFTLTDDNGKEIPFTVNENTLTLVKPEILSEFAFLEESIKEATEVIARFFVGKSKIGAALQYVERSSKAYDILYEYDLWKSLNAGSTKMESLEIVGMEKLGENCFAVEVSALFRATYTETNAIDYPLNYILYYHKTTGKWMIYDLVSK